MMNIKVMKTRHWMILLLAALGLTSRLSYRWGQRTERLDLAYQETV